MQDENDLLTIESTHIQISDDVVSMIASMAASEVPGVAGLSSGIAEDIAGMFGRKQQTKGVKVEVGERESAIDIYVIVEYGVRIPDLSWSIQEKVKKTVEAMTGLEVIEVNVHVQGVSFEKEEASEESL